MSRDAPKMAFPSGEEVADSGMTLRDYFAAAALTGMLSSNVVPDGNSATWVAEFCYRRADEMLKAREK